MGSIFRTQRFHRSKTIDQVLKALEHAGPSFNASGQTSSSSLQEPRPPGKITNFDGAAQARPKPNIWVVDTEFVNLKKEVGLFPLSASITNLLSNETVLNHRLELPIPSKELERIISESKIWQAAHQFKIHCQDPCDLPIISPRGLSHRLKNAGFRPYDYIFVWHNSFVDYKVLFDFLARDDLQNGLMPPLDNCIRVLQAWRELLPGPGVKYGLRELFKLVFPHSPLNETHHYADVDAKKLGMMTMKLRELKYGPGSRQPALCGGKK